MSAKWSYESRYDYLLTRLPADMLMEESAWLREKSAYHGNRADIAGRVSMVLAALAVLSIVIGLVLA